MGALAIMPASCTSSSTYASARPVDSSRKPSEVSLPAISFTSMVPLLRAPRSSWIEVLPETVATFLPLRSGSALMPELFFTAAVMLVTKWLGAKSTCAWRCVVLVVVAQSRSTVPFCSSGMRLVELSMV
ncbi:hypothetical protein D9M69_560020 [compost metagenome]